MTCDQVIIIHKGQVAAAGSIAELNQQASAYTIVSAETSGMIELEPLERLDNIIRMEHETLADGMRFRFTTPEPEYVTQRLCALSVVHGWTLREVRPAKQTLEDLFVEITSGGRPGGGDDTLVTSGGSSDPLDNLKLDL
jgi:ABC-type uncharacterized transport system ATPase subunit